MDHHGRFARFSQMWYKNLLTVSSILSGNLESNSKLSGSLLFLTDLDNLDFLDIWVVIAFPPKKLRQKRAQKKRWRNIAEAFASHPRFGENRMSQFCVIEYDSLAATKAMKPRFISIADLSLTALLFHAMICIH